MNPSVLNIVTGVTLLMIIVITLTSTSITSVTAMEDVNDQYKCPSEFPSKCNCGRLALEQADPLLLPYYGKLVVNCSYTNLTDAAFLKFIPTWTQVLIFTGNSFKSELPVNLFDSDVPKRSLDSLEVIDLSNNQITSIRGKTFHNVKNVKKLILDNNNLLMTGEHFHPRFLSNFESLDELSLKNAFDQNQRKENFIDNFITSLIQSNLKKLTVLNLESNAIQVIPDELAFCSLPSLSKLSLAGNMLTSISFNVSCTPSLTFVDMSDNYISNLDTKTLTFLSQKSGLEVNLIRNPLKCDCRIIPFHRWINDANTNVVIIGKSTLKCASGYPESNIGKLFVTLKENDFECTLSSSLDDDENSLQNYITISFTITIGIIIISIVMLTIVIFVHRENVIEIYSRIVNSITSKQEYTCLNQDATSGSTAGRTGSGNLFIKNQRQGPPHQQTIRANSSLERTTVREEAV